LPGKNRKANLQVILNASYRGLTIPKTHPKVAKNLNLLAKSDMVFVDDVEGAKFALGF
jgi:hypothetical protein